MLNGRTRITRIVQEKILHKFLFIYVSAKGKFKITITKKINFELTFRTHPEKFINNDKK